MTSGKRPQASWLITQTIPHRWRGRPISPTAGWQKCLGFFANYFGPKIDEYEKLNHQTNSDLQNAALRSGADQP